MKTLFGVVFATFALLAVPALATAQASQTTTLRTFAINLMGGIGGSVDESDAGYENRNLQLGVSVMLEPAVKFGVRAGSLDFGTGERLGNVFEPELTYVTLAGEYLFGESTYQSGFFIGLGVYRLEGTELFTGRDISTSRLGVTGGVTGEFDVSRQLSVVAELNAHALPAGEAQFFVAGLVGLQLYIR